MLTSRNQSHICLQLGQTFKAQIKSLILLEKSYQDKCVLVGISVTKALNKVKQRCKHATHATVIHHIGSADSFSVYPVFHQLIRGHVSCFEKLHHERFI